MSAAKIAISIDKASLNKLDRLVKAGLFPSRSSAIQSAVEEKIIRLERGRLIRECMKLNPKEEQTMAEEGFDEELSAWPKY